MADFSDSSSVSISDSIATVPPMRLSGLEPVDRGRRAALFVNIGERTNVTGSQAPLPG